MKKQFTITQLSNLLGFAPQYGYKLIQKPIIGQPYNPDAVNYQELRKFLLGKYDVETINDVLEIENVEDIEIVHNSRLINSNVNKVAIDELEDGKRYILRSYHHEVKVQFMGKQEWADDTVYIFINLNESKNTQDKYRILTEDELSNSRFTIKEIEE